MSESKLNSAMNTTKPKRLKPSFCVLSIDFILEFHTHFTTCCRFSTLLSVHVLSIKEINSAS